MNTGPAREIFLGYPGPPFFRQARIKQVRKDPSLGATESEKNGLTPAPNTSIVILPHRMIVWNTRLDTLRVIEAYVKASGETVHRFEDAARTRRQEAITAVETHAGRDRQTGTVLEGGSSIH
jgi:hypothetical protein